MPVPFRVRRAGLRRIVSPRSSFASLFFIAVSILALTLLGHDFLFPDSRLKADGQEKILLDRSTAVRFDQEITSSEDNGNFDEDQAGGLVTFPPVVPGKLLSIDEVEGAELDKFAATKEELERLRLDKIKEKSEEYERWRKRLEQQQWQQEERAKQQQHDGLEEGTGQRGVAEDIETRTGENNFKLGGVEDRPNEFNSGSGDSRTFKQGTSEHILTGTYDTAVQEDEGKGQGKMDSGVKIFQTSNNKEDGGKEEANASMRQEDGSGADTGDNEDMDDGKEKEGEYDESEKNVVKGDKGEDKSKELTEGLDRKDDEGGHSKKQGDSKGDNSVARSESSKRQSDDGTNNGGVDVGRDVAIEGDKNSEVEDKGAEEEGEVVEETQDEADEEKEDKGVEEKKDMGVEAKEAKGDDEKEDKGLEDDEKEEDDTVRDDSGAVQMAEEGSRHGQLKERAEKEGQNDDEMHDALHIQKELQNDRGMDQNTELLDKFKEGDASAMGDTLPALKMRERRELEKAGIDREKKERERGEAGLVHNEIRMAGTETAKKLVEDSKEGVQRQVAGQSQDVAIGERNGEGSGNLGVSYDSDNLMLIGGDGLPEGTKKEELKEAAMLEDVFHNGRGQVERAQQTQEEVSENLHSDMEVVDMRRTRTDLEVSVIEARKSGGGAEGQSGMEERNENDRGLAVGGDQVELRGHTHGTGETLVGMTGDMEDSKTTVKNTGQQQGSSTEQRGESETRGTVHMDQDEPSVFVAGSRTKAQSRELVFRETVGADQGEFDGTKVKTDGGTLSQSIEGDKSLDLLAGEISSDAGNQQAEDATLSDVEEENNSDARLRERVMYGKVGHGQGDTDSTEEKDLHSDDRGASLHEAEVLNEGGKQEAAERFLVEDDQTRQGRNIDESRRHTEQETGSGQDGRLRLNGTLSLSKPEDTESDNLRQIRKEEVNGLERKETASSDRAETVENEIKIEEMKDTTDEGKAVMQITTSISDAEHHGEGTGKREQSNVGAIEVGQNGGVLSDVQRIPVEAGIQEEGAGIIERNERMEGITITTLQGEEEGDNAGRNEAKIIQSAAIDVEIGRVAQEKLHVEEGKDMDNSNEHERNDFETQESEAFIGNREGNTLVKMEVKTLGEQSTTETHGGNGHGFQGIGRQVIEGLGGNLSNGSLGGLGETQDANLQNASGRQEVLNGYMNVRQLGKREGLKSMEKSSEVAVEHFKAGDEEVARIQNDMDGGLNLENGAKAGTGSQEKQANSLVVAEGNARTEGKAVADIDSGNRQQLFELEKGVFTGNVFDLVGDPVDPQPMGEEEKKPHQENSTDLPEKGKKRPKKKRNKSKGCALDVRFSAKGLEFPPFLPKFYMFNLRYTEFENPPLNDPSWKPRFGGHQTSEVREESFKAVPQKIHCGFVNGPAGSPSTGFTISEDDRTFMEECQLLVVSAVFGDWDHIRTPAKGKVSSWTRKRVCFAMFVDKKTLDAFPHDGIFLDGDSKYGLWKVILVSDMPFNDPRKTGKIPKLISHRLFPNVKYSMWVDSKLKLQVDPILVWEKYLWRDGYEFAISQHYDRNCVWQEVARNKQLNKYNHTIINQQFKFMKADGLKPFNPDDPNKLLPSNVPEGSFILRAHTSMSNLFSCLWFNEVDHWTSRDQISFAYTYFKLTQTNRQKFYFSMFPDCERKVLVKLFRHKAEEIDVKKGEIQDEKTRLESEEEIKRLAAQAASLAG